MQAFELFVVVVVVVNLACFLKSFLSTDFPWSVYSHKQWKTEVGGTVRACTERLELERPFQG